VERVEGEREGKGREGERGEREGEGEIFGSSTNFYLLWSVALSAIAEHIVFPCGQKMSESQTRKTKTVEHYGIREGSPVGVGFDNSTSNRVQDEVWIAEN